MAIFSFLSLFFNLSALVAALGLGVVAAIIYFTLGPVKLFKFATDWRVWLGVIFLFMVVTLNNSEKKIEDQQEQLDSQETEETASHDTRAVIDDVIIKQDRRHEQEQQENAVIDAAPPGDEVDALMDEIAREQAAAAALSGH